MPRPLLAELAGPRGRALELAIGTGRVALPLRRTGVDVHGIDLSAAMVDRLRAKPGGEDIPVVIGDMTATRVDGSFDLVYLVFNTIGNLTEQDAQVACFDNAAHHLRPGGVFVIETEVPGVRWLPPTESFRVFHHGEDHVGIDEYEPVTQGMFSHHYLRQADGSYARRSLPFRYVWPAELDLMAPPRRPAVCANAGRTGRVRRSPRSASPTSPSGRSPRPTCRMVSPESDASHQGSAGTTPGGVDILSAGVDSRVQRHGEAWSADRDHDPRPGRTGQRPGLAALGPAAAPGGRPTPAPRVASASTEVSASARCSDDRVVGVAQDAETPAAQGGRGEVRKVVGRSTQVDQPAPWSQRQRGRRGRLPKTGSTTTSTGPPAASTSRAVSAARSSAGSSTTTSWAPHSCARAAAESDRHTATTRSAPRSRATANAT